MRHESLGTTAGATYSAKRAAITRRPPLRRASLFPTRLPTLPERHGPSHSNQAASIRRYDLSHQCQAPVVSAEPPLPGGGCSRLTIAFRTAIQPELGAVLRQDTFRRPRHTVVGYVGNQAPYLRTASPRVTVGGNPSNPKVRSFCGGRKSSFNPVLTKAPAKIDDGEVWALWLSVN